MDWLEPKTAEEWDITGKIPRGNDNVQEGLKYFDIHRFIFKECEVYSQVADFSGYQKLKGGVEAWRVLLDRWENGVTPSFPEWQGRHDMFVVSTSRQQAGFGGKDSYYRDIIRSTKYSSFSDQYLAWDRFRDQTAIIQKKNG